MGIIGKLLGVDKPKASDYKPTESEKTQSAVAQAEWSRWKENFGGILPEIAAKLDSEDVRSGLRSRANADMAQTVGPISLRQTSNLDYANKVEQARLGQLAQANNQASKFKSDAQADVLAMGQGLKSVTNRGLGNLARIETSTKLKELADEQRGDLGRANVILEIGKAVASGGASNMASGQGEGSFFQPKMLAGGIDQDTGAPKYRDATLGESVFSFL